MVKTQITLEQSARHIQVDKVKAKGITGEGVKVAVVDTGLNKDHEMLKGKVIKEKSFVPNEGPEDGHGHGTWCGSCATGNKAVVPQGPLEGIAPGALLINAKGLDSQGYGWFSWLMRAMEWAAKEGAEIESCSWGTLRHYPPLHIIIKGIREKYGTIFVFAAGNAGPRSGTIGCPADGEEAIGVGSIAVVSPRPDAVANFSSRGPNYKGDIRPDIAAPGGSETECLIGAWRTGYKCASGTSMATPHIAGVIALLKQAYPGRDETFFRDRLFKTARDIGPPGKDNDSGYGVCDAYKACNK